MKSLMKVPPPHPNINKELVLGAIGVRLLTAVQGPIDLDLLRGHLGLVKDEPEAFHGHWMLGRHVSPCLAQSVALGSASKLRTADDATLTPHVSLHVLGHLRGAAAFARNHCTA